MNEFIAKRDNLENVISSELFFYDYANKWLNISKAAREINTREMYESIINSKFEHLSEVPICQIKHTHFQEVINMNVEHPRTCEQISLTFKQVIRLL